MATKNFTTVRIKNETGFKFASIGIVHKYSDQYKHNKEWLNVANGASPADKLIVEYNTGFLTTGRDWWKLVALTEDGRIFETDPNNFRGLIDVTEKALAKFGWEIVKLSAQVAFASGGTAAAVAAPIGAVAAILTVMTNTESTKGFKQFFLEDKDTDHGIDILIKADEVEFRGIDSTATTPFVLAGKVVEKALA